MTIERAIASVNAPTTLHEDAIRLGRAAIMPGEWQRHDPFLSMMNDRFGAGAFGPHPHRGFETLTYVLDGQLRHEDNQGGSGVLNVGDAQWMTAGRGVIHNELPAGDQPVHVLQLWINLPRANKLTAPRYQDLRGEAMPVRSEPGTTVRVFAGQSGAVTGPALTHSPITMLDIRMEAGAEFTQTLPGGYNGFISILRGAGRFGRDDTPGAADDTLWLERTPAGEDTRITLRATEPLHALLLAGQPLQEPVAAYGPFVMNTEADLVQAMADFRAGRFGPA